MSVDNVNLLEDAVAVQPLHQLGDPGGEIHPVGTHHVFEFIDPLYSSLEGIAVDAQKGETKFLSVLVVFGLFGGLDSLEECLHSFKNCIAFFPTKLLIVGF